MDSGGLKMDGPVCAHKVVEHRVVSRKAKRINIYYASDVVTGSLIDNKEVEVFSDEWHCRDCGLEFVIKDVGWTGNYTDIQENRE